MPARPRCRTTRSRCSRFADLSPDRGLERFCAGLTREVIRRLAPVKGLKVAAARLPPAATAAMVVEGRISQAAEGFRLTVNLVNTTSGCYECCESIDVSCRRHLRRAGRHRGRA